MVAPNAVHLLNSLLLIGLIGLLCYRPAGGEVCYRRYLVREDGICKGLSRVLATSAEECCLHRGAKGFATAKHLVEGSYNKYQCLPCTSVFYAQNIYNANNNTTATTTAALQRTVSHRWSDWLPWQACSVTCGGGIRYRSRECSEVTPQGQPLCQGDSQESQPCAPAPCPVNGQWSAWSPYSECNATCGPGTRYRTRQCNAPYPAYGGSGCTGNYTETQPCYTHQCSVDGGWSDWTVWSACSATCGQGWQSRHRTCTNPPPEHDGAPCRGAESESQACVVKQCNVLGGWCGWSTWSPCRWQSGWVRIRTRHCQCPPPSDRDSLCEGEHIQRSTCDMLDPKIRDLDTEASGEGSGCNQDGSNVSCDQEDEDEAERTRHMADMTELPSHTKHEKPDDKEEKKDKEQKVQLRDDKHSKPQENNKPYPPILSRFNTRKVNVKPWRKNDAVEGSGFGFFYYDQEN